MNTPLYIAKRYVFSLSKSTAINIITSITTTGILVGAMVMFIVLSVFSGLREYSLSFINGYDPDLRVTSINGKTFSISQEQENQLNTIEGIASYSKFIEERILFRYAQKEQIAFLKGVDSNYVNIIPIEDKIYAGEWVYPETKQVTIGYVTAKKLSIGIFNFENTLQALAPKPGKGAISDPEQAFSKIDLKPTGVYSFNDEELDAKYIYADISVAQYLLNLKPQEFSGIEIKLKAAKSEKEVINSLHKIFPNNLDIKNRVQLNDALYKMLNTENIIVYLVITLVIIIMLFTLIGTIIMMILDKKTHLKTLVSIGFEIKDLRKVFFFQGVILSFIGCFIGLFLGISIVLLQKHFNVWMLSESLAYPVKFTSENILIVISTVMILSAIASWIAASRINSNLLKS